MPEKSKDYLTKNLPFEGNEEPPKRGEKGYLEPGFRFNEHGHIIDDNGTIYDEEYNAIDVEPSKEWQQAMAIARKQKPSWSDKDLVRLARIYHREIMATADSKKKKKHPWTKNKN